MQTSTIEATWRGIDGRAQEGWYDVRLTHRLVDAAGETILPAGRIAAGRLSEREDEPSVTLTVPAADVDDTAEWYLVVYISFEERRTSETYVLEPVAPGGVIDLALQVPVADVPDGFASGTVVRGIDGKDGRGIESVNLDGDALVFTYDDGTLEFVTVEGGFGGGGDEEPDAPGRGIESLTQVDEVTLVVTFTDETTQTLTLPRGADGDDADPLTITEQRETDTGDTVLTFSDGTEVTVPGGTDGASLTVEHVEEVAGGLLVTFSDNTSMTVPRGSAGRDADALTVTGSTATADGVRVAFSDGSEVVVPRGEDGSDAAPLTITGDRLAEDGDVVLSFSDGTKVVIPAGADGEDGADFTYADFSSEQLEALRGPRGYAGRGVESITDEDGDGVATVTYSDGETSELPLPAGGGGDGGGGFDIDEAGPVTFEHLLPFFRQVMLNFANEDDVDYELDELAWMAEDLSPAFASFMLPVLLSVLMSGEAGSGDGGSDEFETETETVEYVHLAADTSWPGHSWRYYGGFIYISITNVDTAPGFVSAVALDGSSRPTGYRLTKSLEPGETVTGVYQVEVVESIDFTTLTEYDGEQVAERPVNTLAKFTHVPESIIR